MPLNCCKIWGYSDDYGRSLTCFCLNKYFNLEVLMENKGNNQRMGYLPKKSTYLRKFGMAWFTCWSRIYLRKKYWLTIANNAIACISILTQTLEWAVCIHTVREEVTVVHVIITALMQIYSSGNKWFASDKETIKINSDWLIFLLSSNHEILCMRRIAHMAMVVTPLPSSKYTCYIDHNVERCHKPILLDAVSQKSMI